MIGADQTGYDGFLADIKEPYETAVVVAYGALACDPPTPESNRRAAMRCRGLDEAGWPLRDGP